MGEPYRTPNHEINARLRVIYGNGTESDLLPRSLQRALYHVIGEAVKRICNGSIIDVTYDPQTARIVLANTLFSDESYRFRVIEMNRQVR